jgi:hypothetical protein
MDPKLSDHPLEMGYDFPASALFDSSSEEEKERTHIPAESGGLFGNSCSENGDCDSDVDRPILTEADKRRWQNKQRQKIK